jgi:hypothetical protein
MAPQIDVFDTSQRSLLQYYTIIDFCWGKYHISWNDRSLYNRNESQ